MTGSVKSSKVLRPKEERLHSAQAERGDAYYKEAKWVPFLLQCEVHTIRTMDRVLGEHRDGEHREGGNSHIRQQRQQSLA